MFLRSIRARILSLFLLSVVAFAGAMGSGLSQLRTIGDGLEALDLCYLPMAGISAEIEAIMPYMERDGERIAIENFRPPDGHRVKAALYSDSMQEAIERSRDVVSDACQHLSQPEDRTARGDLVTHINAIDVGLTAHDEAMESWLSADDEDSSATLAQLHQKRAEMKRRTGLLAARIDGRIDTVSDQTRRARDRAYAISGALAGLAIIFAAVLAAVALFTLRPINSLIKQVQRLGAGDYTDPDAMPDLRGAGEEVAVLAREFRAMAAAVAERDRRLSERAAALDTLSLRLRQILDTIHAGLVVVEDGSIEVANPAAESTWGVTTSAPLPDWMVALSPGRHESLPHSDRQYDIEVVRFGTRGLLIVGEDVTQRLEVRQRLASAERLAVVGQMLAQITHEVRNPLNAMSLNAELLSEEIETTDGQEMLETITTEIRRLENLTGRYLTLSRRRISETTTEDPVAMVREVLRLEEEAMRRCEVVATVIGEAGTLVDLDGDAMRRALRNVLLNAVEAGATALIVSVTQGENEVVIEVADDGPGMDARESRQAFEPFFTTKAQGTGLGLAISRQELEEVGGRLECESTLGKGTRFWLISPLRKGLATF
ncbi:MAG: C4-dicarboxylate-specific signal transduction histidine kinase [Myxococcota bacterium]|jgi:C4-dicarboxylate-specific signal transduction histidine kinase